MVEVWQITGVERLLTTLYGEPMSFPLQAGRMGYNSEQCASLVDRRELYLMRTAVALIRENLHRSLWAYGGRSFDVLVKRFGLVDGQPWTCRRLAGEHGISAQRISQVEEQAVKRLSTRISRAVLDAGLRAAITTLLGESPPCYHTKPEDPVLTEFDVDSEDGAYHAGPTNIERKGLAYRPRFMAAIRSILEANPSGLSSEMIIRILKGIQTGDLQVTTPSGIGGSFQSYSPSRLMAALMKMEGSGHLVRVGHLFQASDLLLADTSTIKSPFRDIEPEQKTPAATVGDVQLVAKLTDLAPETLRMVPGGLSLALLAHMLRGSDGPVTVTTRDRYGVRTWGTLRDYPFADVRHALEGLVSAGTLRTFGGKAVARDKS